MSVAGISADNAQNLDDIEKQWAVKAFEHAETYFKILCEVEPKTLRLTRIDDELYADFRKTFPDMKMDLLTDVDLNANVDIKEKWRTFIMPYEKRIAHFNFGTLIRLNARLGYSEENSYFVTRTQFYAIEIVRNKEGVNDDIYSKYQEAKANKQQERAATSSY